MNYASYSVEFSSENCSFKKQILEEMHKKIAHYIESVLIFNTNKKTKNKYFDIKYSILSDGVI